MAGIGSQFLVGVYVPLDCGLIGRGPFVRVLVQSPWREPHFQSAVSGQVDLNVDDYGTVEVSASLIVT
jgi:hypothetical protein